MMIAPRADVDDDPRWLHGPQLPLANPVMGLRRQGHGDNYIVALLQQIGHLPRRHHLVHLRSPDPRLATSRPVERLVA